MTEKNRNEIKNGSVLRLQYSPSKTASDALETLRNGSLFDKKKCLGELAILAMDLTFALEFIKEQGLNLIINLIEEASEAEDELLKYSLRTFVELMDHGTVSWEILQNSFVERNIYIVRNFQHFPKCTESALSNLENIVQNSTIKHNLVEHEVTLQDLLRLLQDANSSVILQNTIALINALFMKANETRKRQIANTISSKQYRLALIGNVTSTEMTHQLYVLQTLTLGMLEQRMRLKVANNDQEINDKLRELRRIAFDENISQINSSINCGNVSPALSGNILISNNNGSCSVGSGTELLSTSSTSTLNSNASICHLYKKLGFKCEMNLSQDLLEFPPGLLAIDCMVYFARNYPQQYTKIIHENSCRGDEHECPFGRASIELVKALCDILRIGEPPSDQSVDFQPMFFTHDYPFEEFFCICTMTLNRTWKDMRATGEDFQKVFSVVREQITRTLKQRPDNFEDFRGKIAHFTYQTITNLRQQERTSKEECDSTASAIVKLKEKISPHILDLIKQQRLAFLVEGRVNKLLSTFI